MKPLNLLFATAFLCYGGAALAQEPLGTEFTYQGRLNLNGGPVSATADFEFTLWDAAGADAPPTGGHQIGQISAADNVTVTGGIFTAMVDFGAAAFDGDARWLQIAVRSPAGSGTFETLAPRQPLTVAPYALQTRGLFVNDLGHIGIGTAAPENSESWGDVLDFLGGNNAKLSVRSQVGSIDGRLMAHPIGFYGAPAGWLAGTKSDHPFSFITNGSSRMTVAANGNVGIGTATPTATLSVLGDSRLDGNVGIGITNPPLTPPGTAALVLDHTFQSYIELHKSGMPMMRLGGVSGNSIAALSSAGLTMQTAGQNRLVISDSGLVGIGTASPVSLLHLASPTDPRIRLQDTSSGGKTFHIGINPSDDSLRIAETAVDDRIVIAPSTGNVGIGTTAPAQKLSVAGTVESTAGGFKFPDGTTQMTAGGPAFWAANGTNISNTNAGNVGIGTTSPGSKLQVTGAVRARGGAPGPAGVNDNGYAFAGNSGDNDSGMFSSADGQVAFYTDAAERVRISGANVGVGTTSPETALHIVRQPTNQRGTLSLEGTAHTFMSFYPDGAAAGRKAWFGYEDANTNDVKIANQVAGANIVLQTAGGGATRVNVLEIIGGSDVAEPYDIAPAGDTRPEPGLLVSIDAAHIGRMRVSSDAYDRGVAGIISGANGIRPGMVLRQEGSVADGALPVASFGRVWCWVDAGSGGPVVPGDLLTTSDTPGHAMKVSDAARSQGAVIGKAMSSLETGRGLVLVLVSLQ